MQKGAKSFCGSCNNYFYESPCPASLLFQAVRYVKATLSQLIPLGSIPNKSSLTENLSALLWIVLHDIEKSGSRLISNPLAAADITLARMSEIGIPVKTADNVGTLWWFPLSLCVVSILVENLDLVLSPQDLSSLLVMFYVTSYEKILDKYCFSFSNERFAWITYHYLRQLSPKLSMRWIDVRHMCLPLPTLQLQAFKSAMLQQVASSTIDPTRKRTLSTPPNENMAEDPNKRARHSYDVSPESARARPTALQEDAQLRPRYSTVPSAPPQPKIEIVVPIGPHYSKEKLWSVLQGYKQLIEGFVFSSPYTLIYGMNEVTADAMKAFLIAHPFVDVEKDKITLNQVRSPLHHYWAPPGYTFKACKPPEVTLLEHRSFPC